MSSSSYFEYHGLLLPHVVHSAESLEYAQNFSVEDTDVFAVTYPKSAQFSGVFSSEHVVFRGAVRDSIPKETHMDESLTFAQNFTFKDDDVVVVTYPKSGTVWMQEILPLLLNGGDATPINTIVNWDRVPWLEEKRLAQVVDQLASPRGLISHFTYNLMPPSFHTSKAKVIYVMRNPKDVLVSSYYFHQMASFLEDPGTFDEFMEKFLEGRVLFGKWTNHIKSWKHAKLGDRILFITYEEMVQDLPASVKLMSDFLGSNLSEEVIQKVAELCSFKTMKSNSMSNFSLVPKQYMDIEKSPFLRKGIVRDWKNHFNSEQLARFTSVLRKELEGENFSLPWSLD